MAVECTTKELGHSNSSSDVSLCIEEITAGDSTVSITVKVSNTPSIGAGVRFDPVIDVIVDGSVVGQTCLVVWPDEEKTDTLIMEIESGEHDIELLFDTVDSDCSGNPAALGDTLSTQATFTVEDDGVDDVDGGGGGGGGTSTLPMVIGAIGVGALAYGLQRNKNR